MLRHIYSRDKASFTSFFFICCLSLVWALPVHAALININTAGSTELQTLSGIGPSKAQAIIDYRNTNGPFQKIEDIGKVSGIPVSGTTYANIKDFITVGDANLNGISPPSPPTTTTTENTTVVDTSPSNNNLTVTTNSSHYSSTPITTVFPDIKFAVGAGRDRLGAVGTPIEFKAESNVELTNRTIFQWSFGDGTSGNGESTNHSYSYPGTYVVVLNTSGPDGQAVSRTNVKIVPADLSISFASPERIEVSNNSKNEVNLFGRALMSSGKTFAFPQDTIILPGQKISFSVAVTKLIPISPSGVSLVVVGTDLSKANLFLKAEEQKIEQITAIRTKLADLQQQLSLITEQENSLTNVVQKVVKEEAKSDQNIVETVEPQTASVINTVSNTESNNKSSWFNVLKHFFLRTE